MTEPRKIPALSVVLPTYNRADALVKVLESLETQDCPPESFEVVVVDDGSSDSTARVLADFAATTSLSLRFHSLERNSGPAAARNAALRMARGGRHHRPAGFCRAPRGLAPGPPGRAGRHARVRYLAGRDQP